MFLWGSDSCSSAHHHDGKVIDRPPTLRESNFTGNLQWLLGQSYTLIPEGKHHYGLSFISAVLGQFKPTRRTPFLGAAVEGLEEWGREGSGGGLTQAMTDGKLVIGSKIWLQPIIKLLVGLGAAQWDAGLLLVALLASHRQVGLTVVLIRLHDQQSGLSAQLRLQVFLSSSCL